jgi:hypothetical protein
LTCTKCCGNEDCCPVTLDRCCSNLIYPKKIYATFVDVNGIWPCINGITLELEYTGRTILDPASCEKFSYYTLGPIKTASLGSCTNVRGAYKIASCNGNGYQVTNTSCASPDYSCSSDVNVLLGVSISNGCFPSCEISLSLSVFVEQKISGICRNYCTDFPNSSGGTLEFGSGYVNCNKPINVTNSLSISSLCASVPSTGKYIHYGITGTGSINIVLTE